MGLRDYQEADLAALRNTAKQGHKSILFEASVGYGKSVVITHIATAYDKAGRRVLVLSNRKAVVEQLAKRTSKLKNTTVMTVQAADRKKLQPFDVILVDEAHMGGGGAQYGRVLDSSPNALKIAFTGTPKPEVFERFPAHVKGKDARWLTENGFLSPLRYVCPDVPNLSKARTRNGDFVAEDLEKIMSRKAISGSAISSYRHHCVGRPTLVFCCTVKHAEETATEFRAAGFTPMVLTGKDKRDDVAKKIQHIRSGGLLIAVDKVSAGFDLPDLHAIISLRPTKSEQLWVQQLGRVARAADGKTHGWVFDHAGNAWRCGTLTEQRDWQNVEKDPDAKRTVDGDLLSLRRCEECLSIFEAPATVCPHCGHENGQDQRISKREKARLDEVAAAEIEAARQAAAQARRQEERGEKTLQDWLDLARARGYKPAWAYKRHQLRQRRSAA